METEVKLRFKDKDSLYDLMNSDVFRRIAGGDMISEPLLLENTYIDTKTMNISERGGMIRVRHYKSSDTDRYEFTVKYGGSVTDGLHKRYEWNVKSDDGVFSIEYFMNNLDKNEDSADILGEVFGDLTDDDLTVLCSNSFYRAEYELNYKETAVMACFDSGIIKSSDGSRTDEICELELEMISGHVEDLNELADYFISNSGCVPFDRTKYRRTLDIIVGDRNGK